MRDPNIETHRPASADHEWLALSTARSVTMSLPPEVAIGEELGSDAHAWCANPYTGIVVPAAERAIHEHLSQIEEFVRAHPIVLKHYGNFSASEVEDLVSEKLRDSGLVESHPRAAEALLADIVQMSRFIEQRSPMGLQAIVLDDWKIGGKPHIDKAPHAIVTYFGPTTRLYSRGDVTGIHDRIVHLKPGAQEFVLPVGAAFLSDGDVPHAGPPREAHDADSIRFTLVVYGSTV